MNSTDSVPAGRPDQVRFLGGREYAVRLAADGSGSSTAGDLALTPEPEAGGGAGAGLRIFLRDTESGEYVFIGQNDPAARALAHHPTTSRWQPGRFSILQDLDGLGARLDVCVAPHTPCELRRVELVNRSDRVRECDLTSLAEVVLDTPEAYAAHPAFAKLFLVTAWDPTRASLTVGRRPRDPQDSFPVLVHALLGAGPVDHETSRPLFLGRGRPYGRPAALDAAASLSGTTGTVLDPIVSLRRSCRLQPGQRQEFTFLLGTAPDAQHAARLVDGLQRDGAAGETFTAAAAAAVAQIRAAGLTADEEAYFQDLAGAILCGQPAARSRRVQPGIRGVHRENLRRLGLSLARDWVVVHAETPEGARTEEVMLRAGARWRELALPIQLIIVNGTESAADSRAADGRVVRIRAADLAPAEFHLLNAAARLVITESLPILSASTTPPNTAAPGSRAEPAAAAPAGEPERLRFDNGLGGFNAAGDEYVIRLKRDPAGHLVLPPVPWTNVIANDQFGFFVSETGAGCTWHQNSRENRLTPWSNDAVRDPHGDAWYLRDEESGDWWSCLPGPAPGRGDYEVRHGFGYSVFRHTGEGLALETTFFVPRSDPLRVVRVAVTNTGDRPRRISLFGCARLVLGRDHRSDGRFVTTWCDDQTGALLARNPASAAHAHGVAFAAVVADADAAQVHHTCDLEAFLGPAGDFAAPVALASGHLDDRADGGFHACFGHQAVLELAAGRTATVSFLLGQEAGADWARELVIRYGSPDAIETARREAVAFWQTGLSALQVKTPAPALDLMVNGWLPYQTLSCRIRGRTAFFQSGGAFGFRDQLQDASSLLPLWPERTRQQILLHAAHQFVEGDVLHWWHPPQEQGIRTRFADDLLWLPLLTAEYVAATGDDEILTRRAAYLTARRLEPGEDEAFLCPTPAAETGDLYEHCCRAIDRSLQVGAHGLPLFGTGDWNDGMNRVGREGRGESVWMGFFLVMVLDGFAPLCRQRGETDRADRYAAHARRLHLALNADGWDGAWYRRGYYDNGDPLGSHLNNECRIDALAQAWAVLSGVAPPARADRALRSLEEHLVVPDPGLIKLLAPPFVDTPNDPGYIKGYVAGVRENGGQYTHAALWVVRAMAKAGRRNRAAHLLELLNPIRHTATPAAVAVYQAEPYVVAADVYGAAPHVGRGGWTWYTGSSGWMHRVAVESVLGLHLEGGHTLVLAPCVPDQWPGFSLTWRLPGTDTTYAIEVTNPDACSAVITSATVDGQPLTVDPDGLRIPLLRDGRRHEVQALLGAAPEPGAKS